MYYEFQDTKKQTISQNENKAELLRDVRAYYKEQAMDKDYSEYEVDGHILVIDQFGETVSSERYYNAGCVPSGKVSSPYLQSEFI